MDKERFTVIVLIVAACASLLLSKDRSVSQFQRWKQEFTVSFESQSQQSYRKFVFERNIEKINKHNKNQQRTYDMGLTKFAIYTDQQFASKYLDEKIAFDIQISSENEQKLYKIEDVQIDWTQRGAVSAVRNMGTCASAISFGIVESLESLSKISSGTLTDFSLQEMIDCVYGCTGGGSPKDGFQYVKKQGICSSFQYPYTGKKDKCKNLDCSFKINDFKTVKGCDYLRQAIFTQPIAVYVDASNWSMYKSGIFNNCASTINHFVLLTGLADDYWKIKNNWGTGWGEKGYMRLAIGNTCGICYTGVYPHK